MGALDLPVLIVTGDVPAVVAALVADLDDAILEVTQDAAKLPGDAFADRSVGLINRGMPGYAVDSAGTLFLSALRSSTGWPSGVWLNEPTRYAPDGSGFQVQHWTHDFEYSIVAGAGDWRAAGFAAQGLAFAHPFTAVVEKGVPAAAAARASLLRVDPPSVHASTLKQAGNPFAFPDDAELAGGLTLRLTETLGRDATATVTFGDATIELAHRTDLLEHEKGESVLASGRLELVVGGFDSATVRTQVAGVGKPTTASAGESALEFSRYWLHNSGTAPVGNQPVSVRVNERSGSKKGTVALEIQLAAELPGAGAAGHLRIEVGGGGRLQGVSDVDIAAIGDSHTIPVMIDVDAAASGAAAYDTPIAVTASFVDAQGLAVYDAAAFSAAGQRLLATDVTDAISLNWSNASYTVGSGGTTKITVEVKNANPFEIRGDLLLLTPWGTWSWIDEWTTFIEVPAGGTRSYSFTVAPEAGVGASTTWAIAKLGALGTVSYSETVPLVVS